MSDEFDLFKNYKCGPPKKPFEILSPLNNGKSKSRHTWGFKTKDGIILIRHSWADRLQCNCCGDWCFIHRASDGCYYCDTCADDAVRLGIAKYSG